MTQPLTIKILSLFPHYFESPFQESILKRAQEKGMVEISHVQIRDFTTDKHRKVDDRPFGGGPGMVLKPEPVSQAIRSVKTPQSHVIYLSPQGKTLSAKRAKELSLKKDIILLCGHYEGVDERALEKEVDEEISIGDFVLTNGGLAAIVLVDAVVRFIPGVLGAPLAPLQDSFEEGVFDCPHYTRPEVFEGEPVPRVLLSGDHEKIAAWRLQKAREKTKRVRRDLYFDALVGASKSASEAEIEVVLPVVQVEESVAFYKKRKIGSLTEGEHYPKLKIGNTLFILEEAESFEKRVIGVHLDHLAFEAIRKRCKGQKLLNIREESRFVFEDLNGHEWVFSLKGENT